MLALGCGLLPLLRLARTRRDLVVQLPLAYAVGLAATGVLAAAPAVFGVAVGPVLLSLATVVALAAGLPGRGTGERSSPRPATGEGHPGAGPAGGHLRLRPRRREAGGRRTTRAGRHWGAGTHAPVLSTATAVLQRPCSPTSPTAHSSSRCCSRPSRRSGSASPARSTALCLNLQLLALRRGARRRSLDAPAPLDEPDSAGGFAPRDRHRPGTLQPSPRRLGRHPARRPSSHSASRASRRGSEAIAPACCPGRRSSSAPLP